MELDDLNDARLFYWRSLVMTRASFHGGGSCDTPSFACLFALILFGRIFITMVAIRNCSSLPEMKRYTGKLWKRLSARNYHVNYTIYIISII